MDEEECGVVVIVDVDAVMTDESPEEESFPLLSFFEKLLFSACCWCCCNFVGVEKLGGWMVPEDSGKD